MDRMVRYGTPFTLSGSRAWVLAAGLTLFVGSGSAFAAELCGTGSYPLPYTDAASVIDPFCPGIMQAYVTGICKGTSPTTFSPNDDVPSLQMTTFLQRTVDQVLARGSRRAAFNQWWTPQNTNAMQTIAFAGFPARCVADGDAIWTSTGNGNTVVQIQANTGAIVGAWTGAMFGNGVLAVAGKLFATGFASPGNLYVIDPTKSPGAVMVSPNNLGTLPNNLAFDGSGGPE